MRPFHWPQQTTWQVLCDHTRQHRARREVTQSVGRRFEFKLAGFRDCLDKVPRQVLGIGAGYQDVNQLIPCVKVQHAAASIARCLPPHLGM